MADFPGTTRRFYPGFYLGGTASNPIVSGATFQAQWNTYLAPYYSGWVAPGVYFGFNVQIEWGDLYVNESVRPTDPEDPDDAGYDWSNLDDILTATVLNDGSTQAKAYIILRDRSGSNPQPTFFGNAPYNGTWTIAAKSGPKSVVAFHRQTAVTELSKFYKAFALRYGQDTRIAGVQLEEVARIGSTPTDSQSPIGGATGGLSWDDSYHQGAVDTRAALAENAPQLAVFHKNMLPKHAAGIAGNPGMVARGVWAGHPDPRFFSGSCGTQDWPAVDCNSNLAYWTLQNYRDVIGTQQASEGNGWEVVTYEADQNWDRDNPFGYLQDETHAPTPHIFLWYCGGPAKNDPPYSDLGSGVTNSHPAGVMGIHYLVCVVKNDGTNREWVADWVPAINDLGPAGRFAAPYFPPGFPGAGGDPPVPVVATRINCGDNSYVDTQGRQWDSDATYTAETGSSGLSGTIVNNTGYDDALFTKSRLDASHDNSLFTIPNLANGTYTVRLGFIETYSLATAGFRVFHVDLQGDRVETSLDIYASTGAIDTALVKTYTGIVVDAETLTVLLTDTAADRPHIAFIEIEQTVVVQQFTVEEDVTGYVDRELSRDIDGQGNLVITIDKASVVDWAELSLDVISQTPNEQLRGVKLKTDVSS